MTPRIDFYIIEKQSFDQCIPFVAQLAAKSYGQGHSMTIFADSSDITEQLNTVLWSDPIESFIPHTMVDATTLHIGARPNPDIHLAMTLSPTPQALSVERLLQIVPNDASLKQIAREHYRFYKEQGYVLHSHNIKG